MIKRVDKHVDWQGKASFINVVGNGTANGDETARDGDTLQRRHVLNSFVETVDGSEQRLCYDLTQKR